VNPLIEHGSEGRDRRAARSGPSYNLLPIQRRHHTSQREQFLRDLLLSSRIASHFLKQAVQIESGKRGYAEALN
jgi:hypothetical protein